MKNLIPVLANGGSVIFGFWNEREQTFTYNKRLPRKKKKALRKAYYKFHKNVLRKVLDFSPLYHPLMNGWDSSFSIRIAYHKYIDDTLMVYFSVTKESKDVDCRDLIYRTEGSKEIVYNFKR